MNSKKIDTFNQAIADVKTDSMKVVVRKFAEAIAVGTVRAAPTVEPIVRKQRVSGEVKTN